MAKTGGIKAGRAFVELYAEDSKMVRALRRAEGELRAFAQAVTRIGAGTAGIGAGITAPFVLGAKVFADFETQMANVSTMLDNPETYMARFTQAIRSMSVQFGESTEALAGGLYDILSASIAPEKALSVLTEAIKAARAGIVDTKTAADAITTVLNSYGLSASRAADVSDLLFMVVKRGKTTFGELAPNIGNIANIAATAGISLEELGAAIATLTRFGIRTDDATTAIRAIISTFLSPAKQSIENAKQYGLELSSVTLKSIGLLGALEKISKLPPDAVSGIFENIRALKGVLPALGNLEGFADDIALMANRAGAAEVAFEKMEGALGHSFQKVSQSGKLVFSAIGESISEALKGVSERIKSVNMGIAELILSHKKATAAIGGMGVGLVGLGGALIGIGAAAKVSAFAMSGWVDIVRVARATSIAFTVSLKQLRAALIITQRFAFWHPMAVGLTAVAVAAAGIVAIYKSWQGRTKKVVEETQKLIDANDKMRQDDEGRFRRLQMLSSLNKLTSGQMNEAQRLLMQLKARYGDLGVTLDDTANKIIIAADAQDKLTESLGKSALEDVTKMVKAYTGELDALQKKLKQIESQPDQTILMPPSGAPVIIDNTAKKSKNLKKVNDEILAVNEKINEQLERQKAITAEEAGAITGTYEDVDTKLSDTEALVKAQEDWERKVSQLKIGLIEDEYKREKAVIDEKYDYELAQEKKIRGEQSAILSQINSARKLELSALEQKKALELQMLNTSAMNAHEEQIIAGIYNEQLRARAELNKYYNDEIAAAKKQGASQETINTIIETRKLAFQQLREEQQRSIDDFNSDIQNQIKKLEIELSPDMSEVEKEIAKLDIERSVAVSEATRAGGDVSSVLKLYELMRQQLSQRLEAKPGPALSASGQFGLGGAELAFGSGNAIDRIARATEETAKNTKTLRNPQTTSFS